MPISSTLSFGFLIPAVSITLKRMPSITNGSSIVSLVVPGISVTIALSLSRSLFSKLDLPTLGFPVIIICAPSLTSFYFS